jgi:hypothetical protein
LATQPKSLIDEMSAAARGCIALIVGDRRAADYFDFSLRGVAGSFIAFLVATLINALVPLLFGVQPQPGEISRSLLLVAVLFALQLGCSALVLRQIGRLDGLLPYLVADNWATFFISILSTLLTIAGVGGELAIIAIGILVIIVEINIARLIVTLTPLQIAMFLVAQLVGVTIGLLVLGGLMPPGMAEQLAAPTAQ